MGIIIKRMTRIRIIKYTVHRAARPAPASHLVSQIRSEVQIRTGKERVTNANHNKIWLTYRTAIQQTKLIHLKNEQLWQF